jgi:coproporphyrinogen III oxidase-like Fe-S oxidoreductase
MAGVRSTSKCFFILPKFLAGRYKDGNKKDCKGLNVYSSIKQCLQPCRYVYCNSNRQSGEDSIQDGFYCTQLFNNYSYIQLTAC